MNHVYLPKRASTNVRFRGLQSKAEKLAVSRPALYVLLPLLLAIGCAAALAQSPPPAAPVAPAAMESKVQVGDATHALLSLQASGTSASATPRPISGDVAQRTYDRYLKSFEHPIPESFISPTEKSAAAGK